jgi:iron complex transport system substrate-binding protein
VRRIVYACAVLFMLLTIGSVGASDYTLKIFGNANMDDTIDQKDVAYVESVIKGSNPATNLSDANYDGRIDDKDIDQIRNIINGTEKNITIVCNPPLWKKYHHRDAC